MEKQPELKHINIADITTQDQVRTSFDEDALAELMNSVRDKGVLQPIGVRLVKGKYMLIYGERRYRAAKSVQAAFKDRTTIPAVVYENMTDEQALELQIIENLQRKDVHPIEEAIAFKNLTKIKGFDVLEISKRVSKSTTYVATRLKLNDLIPEFQKAFYRERMTLTTALKLCKIATVDQEDLYKEDFNNDRKIEVNQYTMRQYLNDLAQAPFDINDKTLNKAAGACTNCPFNTAANTLLFPDEALKSICHNSTCYRNKCAASFEIKLKEAIEDPQIILVSSNYGSESKESKALKTKGNEVYQNSDYRTEHKPEPVDREDFEERLQDEEFDSKEEMEKEYEEELLEYKKDLAEYEVKISSGKYTKALVIDGSDKGQTIYVTLSKSSGTSTKSSSKNVKEKLKEGNVTAEDLKNEIKRMTDNEVRKKELDEEKVQPLVYELFSKNKELLSNNKELKKQESVALLFMLMDYHGYDSKKIVAKLGGLKVSDFHSNTSGVKIMEQVKALPEAKFNALFNSFVRSLMVFKLKPYNASKPSTSALCTSMNEVANLYDKKGVSAIYAAQLVECNKREARLKDAVDKLKVKLKEVTKPTTTKTKK